MAKKPKRYATETNPTIQAVLSEMYRFASRAEAGEQLAAIRNHFIVAQKQIDNPEHPSLILWIKGYGISDEDGKRGVIGNYALITHKETNGKFTLSATRLDWDAKLHPQRGQVMRGNPNWGHPVLRAVRKGKAYRALDDAQAELNLLHEHYPKVSIPNPGKLYIMIYCADRPPRERMVKHILTIAAGEDGYYRIECKENTARPARPAPNKPHPAPQGKFTAKVALSLSKKGKKPKPKPTD